MKKEIKVYKGNYVCDKSICNLEWAMVETVTTEKELNELLDRRWGEALEFEFLATKTRDKHQAMGYLKG